MSGARQQALDVDIAATKSRRRFGLATSERRANFADASNHAHAAPPAAGYSFQKHGGTSRQRPEKAKGSLLRDRLGASRHHRNTLGLRQRASPRLVAEEPQLLRRRPNKRDTGVLQREGERSVLAEKPVTGVNRVAVVVARDG